MWYLNSISKNFFYFSPILFILPRQPTFRLDILHGYLTRRQHQKLRIKHVFHNFNNTSQVEYKNNNKLSKYSKISDLIKLVYSTEPHKSWSLLVCAVIELSLLWWGHRMVCLCWNLFLAKLYIATNKRWIWTSKLFFQFTLNNNTLAYLDHI